MTAKRPARPRIAVIGGAILDSTGRSAGRLAAGTSNPGEITARPGGVGRNIAENLARLGAGVTLITALGKDSAGEMIARETAATGVDMRHAAISRRPTGQYLALLNSDGELVSAVSDMRAMDDLTPGVIDQRRAVLEAADGIAADCNLPLEALTHIAAIAAARGIPLGIEPVSVTKSEKLKLLIGGGARIMLATPNWEEARALAGRGAPCTAAALAGRLRRLAVQNWIIGCGAAGSLAVDADGLTEIPAFPAKIASVTGAGDAAFAAAFLALIEGGTLGEAARLGQAAAALTIQAEGAVSAMMTRQALQAAAARAAE